MARIPYLDDSNIQISNRLFQHIKKRRNNRLLNLDRILFYSEPVAYGWNELFSKLRKDLHFSGILRELIILRISILNDAPYEFAQHVSEALKEGVTQIQIDEIKNWQGSNSFDEQQKTVLAYTDAMTTLIQVPDSVYSKLSIWFNNQEIVELTALIAGYNMVSRFLEALKISTDGEEK